MEARCGDVFMDFPPASMSLWETGIGRSFSKGAGSCSTGIVSLGVAGCEFGGRLLRSRGSAMLVRLRWLSPPAERSTKREDGAGLWRLWRCSGRVNSGYSSTVGGRASLSWGCCTGKLGSVGVRGDELTGFHRRDAGGRGGAAVLYEYSERKLRLNMRFVRLQRTGSGVSGAGGRDGAEDEPKAGGDAVVEKIVVVMSSPVEERWGKLPSPTG